jgi:hypothetical protein
MVASAVQVVLQATPKAPLLSDSSSNMFSNSSSGSLFSPVTSIRGLKPANPNWINQDNGFIIENFDGGDIRI